METPRLSERILRLLPTHASACQIGVTFTSGQGTGTLETATLKIANLTVALNGALGAFELFPALNVNESRFAGVTWPTSAGNSVGTSSVALSCPPVPTAVLSATPDGSSNIFQDNTITASNQIGSNPPVTVSNVCYGGDPQFLGFTGFPAGSSNCFQQPYEGATGGFTGANPDTASSGDGSFLSAFGVQPLNLMNAVPGDSEAPPIFPALLVPGQQTLTVTLLDAGGRLGSSTVHLVTNCAASGVTTGGTILAPPLDPNNPQTLTPVFPFNNTNNEHIQFSANYLNSENTTSFVNNTAPQVIDTGVPQGSFAALVHGTSAGPAVCMRLNGELDANGNPQCKAFTLECTIGTAGDASGTNCPQSSARNILFKAVFDSIDTPTKQSQIALGTGPGLLMGTDNWATSGTNCTFETGGPLANQPCPQNSLTQFIGGDPAAGGTTRTTNSTFIPVLNMPLPFTVPVITSANPLGCLLPGILPCWQKSTGSVSVKFFANPAVYLSVNPLPKNGFMPAPIESVTFGTNPANAVPAVPVPDTTYPVPHDVTLFNSGVNTTSLTCTAAPGGVFTATNTITQDTATQQPFGEGRYILHFFATDCANTEELNFKVTSSPTANWASFKTVQINIDTKPPLITFLSKVVSTNTHGGTVKVTFKCDDPALADSSLGSGVITCGGMLFLAPAHTGSVTSTFSVNTQHGTITLNGTDLAGNAAVSVPVSY